MESLWTRSIASIPRNQAASGSRKLSCQHRAMGAPPPGMVNDLSSPAAPQASSPTPGDQRWRISGSYKAESGKASMLDCSPHASEWRLRPTVKAGSGSSAAQTMYPRRSTPCPGAQGNKVSDSTTIPTAVQGCGGNLDTGYRDLRLRRLDRPSEPDRKAGRQGPMPGRERPRVARSAEARYNVGAAVIDHTIYVVGGSSDPTLKPADMVLALRFG